jgi:hypothetical protein
MAASRLSVVLRSAQSYTATFGAHAVGVAGDADNIVALLDEELADGRALVASGGEDDKLLRARHVRGSVE